MNEINPNYIVAVAEQLSFVSAFLGGISATILVTIVVFTSEKKIRELDRFIISISSL